MSQFSSRIWREFPQRYRLEASKFKKSGKTYYPPRDIDPINGDTENEIVRLPDTGKIVTYTVISYSINCCMLYSYFCIFCGSCYFKPLWQFSY